MINFVIINNYHKTMAMKHFTTPDQLRVDSFKLGAQVIKDGFKLDFMICLFRGGAIIGCYVHEILKYTYDKEGHKVDHVAIRTSRYSGIDKTMPTVAVHNLGYLTERLQPGSKVLIVDDVFDTGLSVEAVFDRLREKLGDRMPTDIRVATIDYKPTRNKTGRVPNYYVNISNEWLVYPHELEALTIQEISDNFSPEIADIVSSCQTL